MLNFLQFVPSGQEGDIEFIEGGEGSRVTRPPPTQIPVGIMHVVQVKSLHDAILILGRV